MKIILVLLICFTVCLSVVGEMASPDLIQPIDPANSFDNTYHQNPSLNPGFQSPKPNEGRMNPNDGVPNRPPHQEFPQNEPFNQKISPDNSPNQQYIPLIPPNGQHPADEYMNPQKHPY